MFVSLLCSTLIRNFFASTGGPKSFKLGNRVAYKRADVEQWIEAQYNDTAGQSAS